MPWRPSRPKQGGFDLVLTDMTMPNMTGIQHERELISIRRDIPIIICTGFSEMLNDERAKSNGIKGVLMKPVAKSNMAHMVRKVLDEAKSTWPRIIIPYRTIGAIQRLNNIVHIIKKHLNRVW